MREIQLRGRKKITDGNFVDGTACLYVVGCNTRDALQKRNIRAFSAAEERIEHFGSGFVLIFMQNDAVAALPEIICRRPCCCLQRRNSVRFLSAFLRTGQRFIFHDKKEPPCNGLSGAELFEQLQIVLLLHPAAFVRLLRHLPAHGFNVPVHIRTLGDDLDLQLHRRDFEIADKRIHDVPLLSCTAEQKVDRHNLQNFDKTMVGRIDDAVFDLLNRHIRRKRIAGAFRLLLLPIGSVQHQAARVLCKADAAAVLFVGGGLHSRAGAGLLIPCREDRLLSAASAAALTQASAVTQKTKKQNDIGRERHPRDPDERQKRQRQ